MNNFGFYDLYSTYQKDFIPHNIEIKHKTDYKLYDPIENIKPPKPPVYVHTETLRPLKNDVYIPFDLYFRPKECVHTNPNIKISLDTNLKNYQDELFKKKLEARKTRPRVYMVPQICLDDVPEEIMYGKNGIVENIYTTEWKKLSEIVWKNRKNEENQFKILEDAHNAKDIDKIMKAIQYKGSKQCVPFELNNAEKNIKKWYNFQPIGFVDTTKLFWENNKDKGICSVCEPKPSDKITLTMDEYKEIKNCIEEDRLRQAYSGKVSGYSGYIPKLPIGIKPRQKLFKSYEPWLTTNMIAHNRFIS